MSIFSFDLRDKHIMIAGASSGIGRKTAEMLAENGAEVILVARREERLQEVLAGLEGTGHSYYVVDFAQIDHIEPLVKQIISEQGPLDGMVYCSGMGSSRPVKVSKPDFVQDMFKVNFFGFFELVRSLTKRGRYNPGLSIVGLSSCAALDGAKSQSVYSATKAAMDAAVRVMAQEYAEKGIRVNTVRPGMVRTAMYQIVLDDIGEGFNEDFHKKQFMGLGETEDIAYAVAFLLSPLSKFTTGAHFSVDGGNTCH